MKFEGQKGDEMLKGKTAIGQFKVTDALSVQIFIIGKPEEEEYPYNVSLVHILHDENVSFEEYETKPEAIRRFMELVEVLTAINQEECDCDD